MAMADRSRREPAPQRTLQINEDIPFQRRFWIVERVGWVIMAIVVAAGALGLFSSGPLSRRQVGDPAGLLTVEHQRFARLQAPVEIRLTLSPAATAAGTVSLRLERDLVDALEIERMRPQPLRMWADGGGLRLDVAVAEPGRPAEIRVYTKPGRVGTLDGGIGLAGREAARFSQFVYP